MRYQHRIFTNRLWVYIVMFGSHLKKAFSSDIGVEPSSQVFDMLEYVCGFILGIALISSENPNFEIAPNKKNLWATESFELAIDIVFQNFNNH